MVLTERIRRELGYRELLPREEAFRRTIAWERANPPAQPMAPFGYAAEDEALAAQPKPKPLKHGGKEEAEGKLVIE